MIDRIASSHLWEGVIAGTVMAVTWLVMTGGSLPAPLTPVLLDVIGATGVALAVVCGGLLAWRRRSAR